MMADEKTEDLLKEAREQYAEGEEAMSDLKTGALEDVRFGRLGDQWPADVKADRDAEGRPCLTINDIPATIRQVVNDARQNRPQIKVRPVDSGADVQTAEVMGGLIKHIETVSDADVAYDTGLEKAADARVGYIWVDVDYCGDDTFDLDIKIRPVPNPQAVTRDANSQAVDSSDWDYAFIAEMISKERFERDYPGYDYSAVDFAEDAHLRTWIEKDQIRIANWYKREKTERHLLLLSDGSTVDAKTYEEKKVIFDEAGATVVSERKVPSYEIVHRLITGCDILEEKRWRGSIIPIIPVYGEMINEEGKWHYKSMVTDAKDAQRMFNLSRSILSEMIGRSPKTPWIGPAGIFDVNRDAWEQANQKVQPFLEYDAQIAAQAGPPTRPALPGLPDGLMQDIMAAADDKKRIMSVHDARMGLPGEEISGRAIKFRQHQSDVATFHLTDNLNRAIRCVGRVCIELIPQVYTGERIARIIGTDGKAQNVRLGPLPKDPVTGQPIPPPKQTGDEKVFDFTAGKYDLVVEAGPSYATRRQESAEMLTQYIQAAPQAGPILGPVLVRLSDMPDGEKITNMLATLMPPAARAIWDGTPPPPPQPPPEVAAAQAKAQADFQLAREKAQLDAQLEQQRSQNKLQLEREQAMADIQVMRDKAQAEMELARQRAQLDFELKRQEAALSAELKTLTAAASAAQPAQGAQA